MFVDLRNINSRARAKHMRSPGNFCNKSITGIYMMPQQAV